MNVRLAQEKVGIFFFGSVCVISENTRERERDRDGVRTRERVFACLILKIEKKENRKKKGNVRLAQEKVGILFIRSSHVANESHGDALP